MLSALIHRGPDGCGTHMSGPAALGATRLAITGGRSGGGQPATCPAGRYTLVYNGQVYNYRALRAELVGLGHRVIGDCDTEVVLAAWLQWGSACVDRFIGMWAFAIWDARDQRLFASRDRFGVKPFMYSLTDGRLAFASEIKGLLPALRERPTADLAVIGDYLRETRIGTSERTFFREIQRLPAGSNLRFDRHGLRIEQYWSPRGGSEYSRHSSDPRDLRDLIEQVVKDYLPQGQPFGLPLSGGLDSSTLVCGTRAALPGAQLRTYTASFPGDEVDERSWAEVVCDAAGASPTWVTYSDREMLDALPSVIHAHDEPFAGPSMVAQWFVMRAAARDGLRVVLDGQGSDEVFAGYTPFLGFHLADLLARGRVARFTEEARAGVAHHGVSYLQLAIWTARATVPERHVTALRSHFSAGAQLVGSAVRETVGRVSLPRVFTDGMRSRLQWMLTFELEELVQSLDRNAMAHSIEARVPFLDHRIVDHALAANADMFVRDGRLKAGLRSAIKGLVPSATLARPVKNSFQTPTARYLRGELGELALDVFHSRSFRERGWADAKACTRRLEAHRHHKIGAGDELWCALHSELWALEMVDYQRAGAWN